MLGEITEGILSLHGWIAIAIVFLLTALEASAFVGFVFPARSRSCWGGVLASRGRVVLPEVLVAAVAGAITGDSIGYAVGRRWGHRILRGTFRRSGAVSTSILRAPRRSSGGAEERPCSSAGSPRPCA